MKKEDLPKHLRTALENGEVSSSIRTSLISYITETISYWNEVSSRDGVDPSLSEIAKRAKDASVSRLEVVKNLRVID